MLTELNHHTEILEAKEDILDADSVQEEQPILGFYVRIMLIVLNAERRSIFIHDEENTTTWL